MNMHRLNSNNNNWLTQSPPPPHNIEVCRAQKTFFEIQIFLTSQNRKTFQTKGNPFSPPHPLPNYAKKTKTIDPEQIQPQMREPQQQQQQQRQQQAEKETATQANEI